MSNSQIATITFEVIDNGEEQELWMHYRLNGSPVRKRLPAPFELRTSAAHVAEFLAEDIVKSYGSPRSTACQ